jgi:hypothetical protein
MKNINRILLLNAARTFFTQYLYDLNIYEEIDAYKLQVNIFPRSLLSSYSRYNKQAILESHLQIAHSLKRLKQAIVVRLTMHYFDTVIGVGLYQIDHGYTKFLLSNGSLN